MVKRAFKYSVIALCLALLAACAYYAYEVHQARVYTREVILPKLANKPLYQPIGEFTDRQVQILLKVQDPAFFEHGGVDLCTPGAGLTTITQALVKRLYFKKFRPGIAKIRQTLIAWFVLDPMMPKRDQLELFVNRIGLGHGVQGFAQAARYYHGKEFAQLSEDEYISLVAMIVAPRTFNLKDHPQRNALRVKRIKALVAGEYQPKGLCDQYYGKLDEQTQKGLAPMSYFEFYYSD